MRLRVTQTDGQARMAYSYHRTSIWRMGQVAGPSLAVIGVHEKRLDTLSATRGGWIAWPNSSETTFWQFTGHYRHSPLQLTVRAGPPH